MKKMILGSRYLNIIVMATVFMTLSLVVNTNSAFGLHNTELDLNRQLDGNLNLDLNQLDLNRLDLNKQLDLNLNLDLNRLDLNKQPDKNLRLDLNQQLDKNLRDDLNLQLDGNLSLDLNRQLDKNLNPDLNGLDLDKQLDKNLHLNLDVLQVKHLGLSRLDDLQGLELSEAK